MTNNNHRTIIKASHVKNWTHYPRAHTEEQQKNTGPKKKTPEQTHIRTPNPHTKTTRREKKGNNIKYKREVYTCASFLPEQRTTNATDPPDNPNLIQQHSRGAERPARAST